MANESLYNQLLGHLSKVTSGTVGPSTLDASNVLGSTYKLPPETLIQPSSDTETKSSGLEAKVTSSGIKFGSPSQKTQPVTNNSTDWGQLLSSVASGGLTSLIGGAGSLGLGSLVSGLIGLFGGSKSKTLPPLTLFQLPASQDVTVYTGSTGAAVYQGSMDQTVVPKAQASISSSTPSTSAAPSSNQRGSGADSPSLQKVATTALPPAAAHVNAPQKSAILPTPAATAPTEVNSQWFMERSNDIAAAVRNAMLNSSSLNDVVAEV
jgi:hypothetical protein